MNEDIKKEFRALQGSKQSFVKGRFNVYFAKTWGSKAFFMHLVRFGTSSDIARILEVFNEFRQSKEYKDIVKANSEKTAEERAQKQELQKLRRKRHRSPNAEEDYWTARNLYNELGRGSHGGVAQGSWVEEAREFG